MKRMVELNKLLILGFMAVAAAAVAADSPELKALYEKAKSEGGVTVTAGMPPKALRALENGFNKRFPGVEAKIIGLTASDATTRILTETKVGNATIGVSQMTASTVQPLLEAGLVSSYDYSKTFGIPEKGILYDNRIVPWFDLVYVLAYNTRQISRDEVPTTWEGLLDPKWKNRKLVLIARGHPFQYMPNAWGEEKVMEFAKKIKTQEPIMTPRGGNQVIEAIVSGQALIGPIHLNRVLTAKVLKNAPIDYVWLDYTPVLSFYSLAINKVAAPHSAILMAGWLATPEAGHIMEKHSFRALTNPESQSETSKLLAKANTQLVPTGTTIEAAKQEADWQQQVRKIFVGQ